MPHTYHHPPDEGMRGQPPPWQQEGPRLSALLEGWRTAKERSPGFVWLRALRPPPLPLGTAQKAIFRGHEESVRSVAYSPDGQRIATWSLDKTVRVWDAAKGTQVLCLRGHENLVMAGAYSPDGQRIASGSHDQTVRIWDATRPTRLHRRSTSRIGHLEDPLGRLGLSAARRARLGLAVCLQQPRYRPSAAMVAVSSG